MAQLARVPQVLMQAILKCRDAPPLHGSARPGPRDGPPWGYGGVGASRGRVSR